MGKITTATELQNAIQNLKVEQEIQGQLLSQQFTHFLVSIKPINLIKGALNDVAQSPFLTDNILGASLMLATGYLSKKINSFKAGIFLKNILASVMKFGLTNLVAQPHIRIPK